ncbi:MAG: heavy-metal-associated domain-containing protein [Methylococcaceae bacterium]|nr:heavy-metal-associated domain-containing protein [Methylococcaceae bacterium]
MSESVILNVTGMKCGGCETNVTLKLNALDGVKSVKASHREKQVTVEFDADKTSVAAITQAIIAAGYVVA